MKTSCTDVSYYSIYCLATSSLFVLLEAQPVIVHDSTFPPFHSAPPHLDLSCFRSIVSRVCKSVGESFELGIFPEYDRERLHLVKVGVEVVLESDAELLTYRLKLTEVLLVLLVVLDLDLDGCNTVSFLVHIAPHMQANRKSRAVRLCWGFG
jgi:hypothetical protein